jgi:outer membrane protein
MPKTGSPHRVPVFGSVPRLCVLGLAGLGLLVGVAAPLRAHELRVGYVNTLVLLKKMPQSLAARRTLEHEFTPELNRIHKEEIRLAAVEKRYKAERASLSLLKRTEEQQKISSLVRRLRRHQRAYFEDLDLARDQVLANLQHLLVHAIHEYARRHHYDLVVGQGVFYAGPRVDITRKVLAYLTTLDRGHAG